MEQIIYFVHFYQLLNLYRLKDLTGEWSICQLILIDQCNIFLIFLDDFYHTRLYKSSELFYQIGFLY